MAAKTSRRTVTLLFCTASSGFLAILAFPGGPLPFSQAAWIFLVPFLLGARSVSVASGAICGCIFGAMYSMICSAEGIYNAFHFLADGKYLPLLLIGVFYLPYILPFGILGGWQAAFKPQGLRGALTGSAMFLAAVHFVPTVITVNPFPITPAMMLHTQPAAIQAADLGGVPLVNFILFTVNFLVAEIVWAVYHRSSWKKSLSFLAVFLLLVCGYGAWRRHEFGPASSGTTDRLLTAALIQPNLPEFVNEAGLIRDNRTQVFSALEMTRQAIREHPDVRLVVWPETPANAPCGNSGRIFQKLSQTAADTGVSFLIQCVDCSSTDQGAKTCRNAARLISPGKTSEELYYKQALIPFFESAPTGWFYRLLAELELIPVRKNYETGQGHSILATASGIRLLPLICYDAHFPQLLRESPNGDLIVVMSNLCIFGKSRIADIDFAMNMFRAVEIRRAMVKVANSGISAFISASGEIIPDTLTLPRRREAKVAALSLPDGRTVYAQFGDLFLYLVYCFCGADIIKQLARRLRLS